MHIQSVPSHRLCHWAFKSVKMRNEVARTSQLLPTPFLLAPSNVLVLQFTFSLRRLDSRGSFCIRVNYENRTAIQVSPIAPPSCYLRRAVIRLSSDFTTLSWPRLFLSARVLGLWLVTSRE